MATLTQNAPRSQAEREAYNKVAERIQRACPWREDGSQEVFPCEAMPLWSGVCQASSPSRILAVLRSEAVCPFGATKGCPFEHAPD